MADFKKTLERQAKELNAATKHVRDHVGDLGDRGTALVAALLVVAARLEVLEDTLIEVAPNAGRGI